MSEIEKLYKNAGVEKREQGYCDWDSDCPYDMDKDCGKTCPYWVEEESDYPPFTAEKQLSLIKWLMVNNKDYQYNVEDNKYWFIIDDYRETKYREFDEALAELINLYWQDLTESEQEQIRSILNEN